LAAARKAAESAQSELAAARAEIRRLTDESAAATGKAQSQSDTVVRELSAAQERIRQLTAERDSLAGQFAQLSVAADAVAQEHAAARDHIAGLAELRDRAAAESAEIRAWAENVLAHANRLHERLQLLDGESLGAFLRRRYLRRG
jgi:chromosome segregation ATPase